MVACTPSELAHFDPPDGVTCFDYLLIYLVGVNPGANLLNPSATADCQVCPYSSGTDYLATINIKQKTDGWRNVGITGIFVISSYALVFVLMKVRTKATKRAE
jgi:ATP-binding cassette subfamily G (WHITE) protein 2 (SNQ2)